MSSFPKRRCFRLGNHTFSINRVRVEKQDQNAQETEELAFDGHPCSLPRFRAEIVDALKEVGALEDVFQACLDEHIFNTKPLSHDYFRKQLQRG